MEYEYNEDENSLKSRSHDLLLLEKSRIIHSNLIERLELKLQTSKSTKDEFSKLAMPSSEDISRLYCKLLENKEIEIEMYKNTLLKLHELINSAIRLETKNSIKESYDLIETFIHQN